MRLLERMAGGGGTAAVSAPTVAGYRASIMHFLRFCRDGSRWRRRRSWARPRSRRSLPAWRGTGGARARANAVGRGRAHRRESVSRECQRRRETVPRHSQTVLFFHFRARKATRRRRPRGRSHGGEA